LLAVQAAWSPLAVRSEPRISETVPSRSGTAASAPTSAVRERPSARAA
jgi:hypothetical protein